MTQVPGVPRYRLHIWPWLRRPAHRFILDQWLAITVWDHIFAWRALDEAELAHELAHVAQWRQNGLRFVLRYWRASRSVAITGLHRYRDNRFEAEARAAEDAIRARRSGSPTPS